MSRLSEAEAFVAVFEAGGFSAAGRRLGLSQPAVSRRIAELETRLGTRLFVRSTRALRPTDAGRAFYDRCRRALAELDDAEIEAGAEARAPRGLLRVSAPPVLARRLLVPRLHELPPEITVDLLLVERFVDLAAERIDVAIRLPDPGRDPDVVARRLATFTLVCCAAPAYLATHGVPRRPDDLTRHRCLVQAAATARDRWTFQHAGRREDVHVAGTLRTNDMEALRIAALAGAGVALLPSFLVDDDLRHGTLRPLLRGWRAPGFAVFAVYRERRLLPMKVRVFVDFAGAALRGV